MKSSSFDTFVLDQLKPLDGLRCRTMFGGRGLYKGGMFFGILHRGRLYFKTDAATVAGYVDRGMTPFRPNERQTLGSYYEVPIEVIENAETLADWARRAATSYTPAKRKRAARRSKPASHARKPSRAVAGRRQR
jgi:DNA transformation protein